MKINEYFDKVYLLNLFKRSDRLSLAKKRLEFCDINYQVFNGVDGSVMQKIWESFYKENAFFCNSSYLGCCLSHLSIYKDAIEKGYKRILIIEDDNRILRNANDHFSNHIQEIPEDWNLLYLGFIPLSDDCSRWDYNIFKFHAPRIGIAKNFWGLFGYGIQSDLMAELLNIYDNEFPMELDRFFVREIQPRNKSYAITPQIFAADNGVSDNSGKNEIQMLERSTDSRFIKLTDYI